VAADFIADCDKSAPKPIIYTYQSDIARAEEQTRATVTKMKDDKITSVYFYGDPIAPKFFTTGCTQQGFFPEHVLTGTGLIDYDVLGRLYNPEQWKNAFGLSHLTNPLPFAKSDAAIVYKGGGGTYDDSHPTHNQNLPWAYFNLMATGIQQAGPNLTPANFERGLLSTPPSGGWAATKGRADVTLVKFAPGDYTAISDAREVYWDSQAISSIDGKPGAYVSFNGGRRYANGEWPAGEPALPGR
jgi:hypothetical protein